MLTFYFGYAILYLELFLNRNTGVIAVGFPETFKALSDPVRREILTMLKGDKLSAGDIASHFSMTGATISYHLSQLKKANLIFETHYKNFIYYEINTSVFEEIMLWTTQFLNGGNSNEEKI